MNNIVNKNQLVMLSIKEVSELYPGVTANAVRQFVRTGKIPCVRCGRKILICKQILDNFLLHGESQPPPIAATSGIRPIAINQGRSK